LASSNEITSCVRWSATLCRPRRDRAHHTSSMSSTGAGGAGATAVASTIEKLATLQNLIKRDPETYADEFMLQHRAYEAELELLKQSPGTSAHTFVALIMFLAHVSAVYPRALTGFPTQLMALLESSADVLAADVRRSIAQAVILMRNKRVVDAVPVCKLFFQLFAVPDRTLRELMFTHIVHDVRSFNKDKRDEAANRAIQSYLYGLLESEAAGAAARKALDVMVELYRRHVWTDARTVNVMARALTSSNTKLLVAGLKFFLGAGSGGDAAGGGGDDSEDAGSDGDSDDAGPLPELDKKAVRDALSKHAHSRATNKRMRQTQRLLTGLKKNARKTAERAAPSFPAIQLLHDPQGLAEKLFASLRATKERFEVRLMMMNLISRLVGQHKLLLLPFYSFVQKYLAAHQANVTQVLAYLVQACHDLVPPDEVLPVVRTIANNFITDRCPPEVIQVGLNAVREVIAHCPIVLEEDGMRDLVHDLIQYKAYRNKAVVGSARALLNLIRDIYPAVLRKKDRGKEVAITGAAARVRPTAYGQQLVATGVDGADLLALALARKAQRRAAAAAARSAIAGGVDDDVDMAHGGVGHSDGEGDGHSDAGGSHAHSLAHSHHTGGTMGAVTAAEIAAVGDDDEWAAVHLAKAREFAKASKPGYRGEQATSAAAAARAAEKALVRKIKAARAASGGGGGRGAADGDEDAEAARDDEVVDEVVDELAHAEEGEGEEGEGGDDDGAGRKRDDSSEADDGESVASGTSSQAW